MNWINRTTIRNIIAAKIVAVIAIVVFFDDGFKIGDRLLSAADKTAKDTKAESTEAGSKDETSNTDRKTTENRRSFIDDLINLPTLETKDLKKDEIGRYLALAERKQQQIEERLDILKKRETQLLRLEKSLDTKIAKIEEERQFLRQTVQDEKNLKDERVTNLVAVYKKMDPKKAAPLFEKMDKDLAVEMFKQFPEKQVMGILAKMTPEKSVEITEYYGRVKSMREYDLLKEMNSSLKKEFEECKGLPQTSAQTQTPASTSPPSNQQQAATK